MLLFPAVVLICCCGQSVYGEQDESCDVRKMSDRFMISNPLEDDVLHHGSTVTTKCKFTDKFSFAQCMNGKWRIQDTECSPDKKKEDIPYDPSLKKLVRKKRWGIRIRFRRIVRGIGRFIGGVIGGVGSVIGGIVCTVFNCPSHRRRDSTPPEIRSCPKDQTVTAIPIQHHAFVDWTPPTAWDNRDGQVSVHINGPYRPGGPFFERPNGLPTTVGYYAKDKSGNMATCNFNIYVRVVRCPMRTGTISDGYRKCHPSSDMVRGTVCYYGCYQGHDLKGPSRIECTDSGTWSTTNEPYCQKKECSAIVPRGELSFTCSAALYFRSICTFGCNQGYDIPEHIRRTKVCLASGLWNGNDPECVDVAPPTFEQCPSTMMFFPGDNEDKAYISWEKPSVIDNKDYGLEAEQIEGPLPASQQEVNTYTIKYTAKDSTGNEANHCTFDVIVKQLRCPRLYPLPYMTLNCTGTRRGSQCSFACGDNSVLNGSKTTHCQRKDDMPYSEWTMDTPPFCEILNDCPSLTPPANGALACDYWLGGRFCHPSCSNGYSTFLYALPNMLICTDNGVWLYRDRLSDCRDTTTSSRRYVTMAAEFYFEGDCNDLATQMEIKQKFMTAIENSNSYIVKKMCQSPQCNVGNVRVICGSTSKRSTENMKIYADIYLYSGNTTLTSYVYEEEVSSVTEFLQSLQDEMNSGNFSIVINDQVASLLEVTSGDINLDCPENSVPMYNKEVVCVECPPGTFYNQSSQTCSSCLRGSYQPHRAQNNCLPCPSTQTTGRVGATDVSECEDACSPKCCSNTGLPPCVECDIGLIYYLDACLPGLWSNTGLPPCVECDIGYYEDQYGSVKCSQCPGNRITVKEGSKNVSDCVDFDIVFPNITTTSYTELQLFSVSVKAPFIITFHVVCQRNCEGSVFRVASSSFDELELTSSDIIINSLSFDITESMDLTRKWLHVHLIIGESNTELFIDGEKQQEFSSNINFIQNQNADLNITLGGNGFIGTISQFNIVSNTTYDFHGDKYSLCNSAGIPSDLVNWNEFAYSSLLNSYINIPSRCDDVDGCEPDPCNHGNCTDKLGGYTCNCLAGYKGKNCDVDIDDCMAHACQNNATCVDEVNAYSCSCEYGFTGELCEIAMVDGEWSEWDNWTECSVSCGNGTIQRRRTCSDPPPDNGGMYCNGSDTETEQCSMEPCRECSELYETENSTLSCTNITGMLTCTHTCNEGYDFDKDVKPEYTCGNETYHYWDFQTEDNPNARLPHCSEIHESTKLHVKHKAFYNKEGCDSTDREDISNILSAYLTAAVGELSCVISNICTLSTYSILNCENDRRKRDTSDTNLGFSFTLSCNTIDFGTESCFYGLEDAITEFELLETNDTLSLEYNNNTYYIIHNASTSDSTVDCPIGTVPLTAYCVPCSIGHYYLNQECHSCPKGTYQDTIGQASCTSCPEGLSTEGTNSVSVDDCIVPVSVPTTESKSLDIVLGVGISIPALVIIAIVVIALRQNKICKGSKNDDEDEKRGSKYDHIRNVKFDPNKIPFKGDQTLSIIDYAEATDNELDSKDGFVNNSYDFEDIVLNGVNSPPQSHWPILTIPREGTKLMDKKSEPKCNGDITHDLQITPRECWTPETSS